MATSTIPFKKIALYLFSLLLVFALFIVVINSSIFDEELHPEVKLAMQVPPEINPQKNAYLALFGMQAAAGKDMQQVGIQLTTRYLQNRDQHQRDELTQEEIQEIAGGKNLDEAWSKQYKSCNSRQENGCLAKMVAQINSTPMTDTRFNVMLKRYQQLLEMQDYQELQNASAATPLPQFGLALDVAKIYLAQASTEKNPMTFLTALQKDMRFWRRVLSQGNAIISKMIAIAALRNDLQYLSEFMQSKTLTEEQKTLIQQLLVTLDSEELNIAEAISGEGRWLATEFNYVEKNWLSRMAFQYNATLNANYFYAIKHDVELAKLSSIQLAKALAQVRINEDSPLTWSPSSLYNFIGKALVATAHPYMQDYIARVHDLNGMILLVQLQLSLKGTPNDAIESSVQNSPIKNPYTNQAMQWNQAEAALQFNCLASKSICRINIENMPLLN